MGDIVNLFNEIGMLAHTPRSGFAFLGSGEQSVAEHSYRMTLIAYCLASMVPGPVDKQKLLLMCLLHDLPEARTGDLNYVNKKYVQADEAKAIADIKGSSSFGPEFSGYLQEYNEGKTVEAKLAHDADQLELLLVLKKESEKGNSRALQWFDRAVQRLQTQAAKTLAEEIKQTPNDSWWFRDQEDPHWIHGGKPKNLS